MLRPSEVSLEKLFVNHNYRVLHVLNLYFDVNLRNQVDMYFKVLLKDEDEEGYYRVLKIPPWLLRYYSYGTLIKKYREQDKERTDITFTSSKVIQTFDVPYPKYQTIKRIRDVISHNEYPIKIKIDKIKKDFSKEIQSQYCIILQSGNTTFIFPAPVIGSSFFFISQRFTEDLFNTNLEIEYHKVKGNSIHLKGGYDDANAPFLYLYATNQIAREVYDSIGQEYLTQRQRLKIGNRVSNKIGFTLVKYPFKAYFPFSGEKISFVLRGKWLTKTKFFVYAIDEILDLDRILGINELVIQRTERKKSVSRKISYIPKKLSESTNVISENVKADEDEYYEQLEINQQELDKNFKLLKDYVDYPHESTYAKKVVIPEKQENSDKPNLTFFKNSPELPSKGKYLKSKTGKNIPVSDIFSLDDFLRYFKEVCFELGIDFDQINKIYQKIKSKNVKNPKIPLVNQKTKRIREYLILKFMNESKRITIVEIDHTDLIDKKLYTLVFAGDRYLADTEIFKVVHYYLDRNSSLRNIERYFDGQGIFLYKKRHPKSYVEKDIKNWIDTFIDVLKYKV